MTQLLDDAIARARALPPETQDALARAMFVLLDDEPEPIALSPQERASLGRSLDQADRGEFASDERVRAIWAKHGL